MNRSELLTAEKRRLQDAMRAKIMTKKKDDKQDNNRKK